MRSFFAVCFTANLLAVIVLFSADGAKSQSSAGNQTPAKPCDADKISQAISFGFKSLEKKLDKLIEVVNASHEELAEPSFASCSDIYRNHKAQGNKAYMLQMSTGKARIPVYCHMTSSDLGACGGGGWTLVMKTDGSKRTFHYKSTLWSNKNDYNLPGGKTGFDTQETKLPTYWNTPFAKICLGMRVGNHLRFILVNKHANSLYSLVYDGVYRPTSLGRNTWKTLIGSQVSLQSNCNKEGFNAVSGESSHARARIGILGNNENDCYNCDSRIGFGTGGNHDDSNTCGNQAKYSDNGDKHIKAMGYIFVQ